MSNHDIAQRYREELATCKLVSPEPKVQVITPPDNDIEKERARQQRKFMKFLKEIVTHGRSTVTIRGPELKGKERATVIAGYKASLARQKRKLLLEKLRRLEAAHQAG